MVSFIMARLPPGEKGEIQTVCKDRDHRSIIVEHNGALVAALVLRQESGNLGWSAPGFKVLPTLRLEFIAVSPDYRSYRVGIRLIDMVMSWLDLGEVAKEVNLSTSSDKAFLEDYYLKRGFTSVSYTSMSASGGAVSVNMTYPCTPRLLSKRRSGPPSGLAWM